MTATLQVGADTLSFTHTPGRHTDAPGVVFLPGFRSHQGGDKAQHLHALARAQGWSFTALDYRGHGASSGDFEALGVSDWADDANAVFRAATRGPQVLVGSSMGAWIALRVALANPTRIKGLVTVAAAPDFTKDLLLPSLSAAQRTELEATGRTERPSAYGDGPYPITQALFDRSRSALVLRSPISLPCPLRALHGEQDTDVPIARSDALLRAWTHPDKSLTRIPDGDHRLSRPSDLALLTHTLTPLMA